MYKRTMHLSHKGISFCAILQCCIVASAIASDSTLQLVPQVALLHLLAQNYDLYIIAVTICSIKLWLQPIVAQRLPSLDMISE
jgi:hypothetical protein